MFPVVYGLTQQCLVTPYNSTILCHHWFRQWLGASQCQTITWNNTDLSMKPDKTNVYGISKEMQILNKITVENSITKKCVNNSGMGLSTSADAGWAYGLPLSNSVFNFQINEWNIYKWTKIYGVAPVLHDYYDGVAYRKHNSIADTQGLYSLRRPHLAGIGIPIINTRRSDDCLRFIMGIPLPIKVSCWWRGPGVTPLSHTSPMASCRLTSWHLTRLVYGDPRDGLRLSPCRDSGCLGSFLGPSASAGPIKRNKLFETSR